MAKVAAIFRSRRRDVDMTQGGIMKNLLNFAFPLLIGNLFQQLYNMVDTWVIGQTDNSGAYAAVGSVGPIINILIGFFMGLASGAGVIISQYYGAKDTERVRRAVHTAATLTLIMGVAFTLIGILMTPTVLDLMLHSNSDADAIYPHAKEYLTIYFAGVMGLMIYNMGSGILRAVGDSTHPFYYLVVSAVINIVLDLVFVFQLDMGVAGVAYATVIAQCTSAVLTVITLLRTESCVRIVARELRIDTGMLKMIVRIGIPAAIQMALTAFSNVFVQSYIANVNADKTACLGGWTSYSKIDQFIFLPVQSLALATTTFVGQNLGVGNIKRAKRGTTLAYLMSTVAASAIIVTVMVFAPTFARVFNDDPDVVYYATLLLRTVTPFYLCTAVNQIFSAALRGAGNTRAPMIIMLCSFVGFRQLYLFVVSNYISNELLPVAMGYPAGWMACCITTLIYYLTFSFEKSRLIKVPQKAQEA